MGNYNKTDNEHKSWIKKNYQNSIYTRLRLQALNKLQIHIVH